MATPSATSKDTVKLSDESFHILRECRTLYLNELGRLLRDEERVPREAVEAFQQSVGAYFDKMVASRRRSGFESAGGMTASRISLVGESDLELEIRLKEFSARLMESTGGDLWRVFLRLVTLLNRPDLSTTDNPVSPKGISLGLVDFCASLGENHEQTLARIERLEKCFGEHLPVLYTALDEFLTKYHIAAAQPAIITAAETPNAAKAGNTNNLATANPAIALQQRLLGPGGESMFPQDGAVAGLLSQNMLERMFARLEELEKSGRYSSRPSFSSTATSPSLENLIPGLFSEDKQDEAPAPHALNAHALGIPGGAPEAATIDTLGLIFETIFASPDLPAAIKSILSSLQIPLLKAAMSDAGFFAANTHPARQFLDGIAAASLGLPLDVSPKDPLCLSIEALATRARSELSNNPSIFAHLLGDLKTLIIERDHAVSRRSEEFLPLLFKLDRRKQAQHRCRQVIEQHLAQGAPASIVEFLRTWWQNLLIEIWLENGEQGVAWQEYKSLIGDLLWTVQPKADMEDRKRLAKMLQPMLQKLNAGMTRIGVPEETQGAFLDTCFALQTAAMRGAQAPVTEAALPSIDQTPAATCELATGNLRLKLFDRSVDASMSAWHRPPPARSGTWLKLAFPDQAPLVGRLSQISADSGWLLIANTAWDFAVAMHPEVLENMLGQGTAHNCSDDSLFDDAAEQALSQTPAAYKKAPY